MEFTLTKPSSLASPRNPAVRGVLWTVTAYGSNQVLRFATNLILTRLLVPEIFGVMALVNSLRLGLELFSDLGIVQNIIQSPRGDQPTFLNTAWTMQIVRGVVLWIICLLVAKPLAEFYDEPQLAALVGVVCLTLLLNGFVSTKVHILKRRMMLGRVTALEMSRQLVSLAVMVICASIWPNVWALAAGAIAASIYRIVFTHCLIPGHPNRLQWDASAAKEVFSFGKWIFVASLMMFLAEQSDRFILGKLMSLEVLGVLTIAFTLAQLPKQILKQIGYKVIFPLVSRKAAIPRLQLRNLFLSKRQYMLIGVVGLFLVLVGGGDLIVDFLYDDRYRDATWAMPLLCLGGWFSALFYTSSPCLLGLGKPHYSAQSNCTRFISIALGIPIGFYLAGIFGAVVAIGVSDIPAYIVIQLGLMKEQISTVKQDALFTIALAIGLSLIVIARLSLGIEFPIIVA